MNAVQEAVDFAVASDDSVVQLIKVLYYENRPTFDNQRALQNTEELPQTPTHDDSIWDGAVHSLHTAASARAAEARQAYQANAAEIDRAVTDFNSIQQLSNDLTRQFKEVDESLAQLGTALAAEERRKETARIITGRINDTRTILAQSRSLLQQCNDASKYIESHKLLNAMRLIEQVEQKGWDGLGDLGQHIRTAVEALNQSLENQVLIDLNTWLAETRDKARAVGERRIAAADVSHQQREAQANAALAMTHVLTQNANTSGRLDVAALTKVKDRLTAATPSQALFSTDPAASSGDEDSVCGLDMAPLHRCAYILGRRAGGQALLLERYYNARALQLAADLAPTDDMVDNYRSLLAVATGHFVIEDRVGASVEGLDSSSRLTAAWEGSAAALSAVLRSAMEDADSYGMMLGLKEVALLCCDAIDACNRPEFNTGVLRDAVLAKANRYRESLAESAVGAVREAQGNEAKLQDLAARITLDARAFLSGLLPPERLDPAAQMETELVLATALEAGRTARRPQSGGATGVNTTSSTKPPLSVALEAIKQAVMVQHAVVGQGPEGRPASASPLGAAVGRAESQAASAVASVIQLALYEACSGATWTPTHMPKTGGSCSPTFAPVVEVVRQQKRQLLAVDAITDTAANRVVYLALKECAAQLMNVLASQVVPGFNMFGLQQLLSDLHCLERCCHHHAGQGGQPGTLIKSSEVPALQEPILFCQLIVFGHFNELLDPGLRASKYGVMDMERCAALLTKVKDLPPGTPGPNAPVTRKALEPVIKELRKSYINI